MAKYALSDVPKADLVIIWIGQSDLMWGAIKPGDLETGTAKYKELLVKVRDLRPDTPVLCLYPEELTPAGHPQSRVLLEEWGGAAKGYGPDSAYARQQVG